MNFKHKGHEIKIDLPKGTGNVGKTIRKGKFYEERFLNYIAKQDIDGVYIDVGANIGNHSIYFGLFTPAEKVLSFEPHPKVFGTLQKNISNNKLNGKIKAYNVALGDKTGKCSIEIVPSDEIGGSRVIQGNDIDQWKLDKFINEKITLIKIDVEGYEEFVIKGATKVIKTYKPELFVELTSRTQYKTVFGILEELGYKQIAVFNNSATYHFSTKKQPGMLHYTSKLYPIRRAFLHS